MDRTAQRRPDRHVTENDIAGYLVRSVSRHERDRIAAHIAGCADCLAAVVSSYESAGPARHSGDPTLPLRRYMKNIFKKFNPYLALAAASFALSFVTPRYFIQLLVATLLLGIKWIVDSKTTKMLVMIYEAWKQGGEREASKVLERIGRSETVRF